MRILHTADWHLGKKLESASRLDEQKQALAQIERIAAEEGADIVLIAGDVFDTFVPTAEAERLFFECAARLGKNSLVVALAGNHDDPVRLSAPDSLAGYMNVVLLGEGDREYAGEGYLVHGSVVEVERGGEKAVIGALPFPSLSRLSQSGRAADANDYRGSVEGAIKQIAAHFQPNAVNIFASHLFMTGAASGDERELGSAVLLPKEILPVCDYVALGHVHRPQTVSKSLNAYYSGSILPYSFDDTAAEKSVILYDSKDKSVKRLPIAAGKRLYTFETDNLTAALEFLDGHDNSYVHIVYGGEPLTISGIKELKSRPSFLKLTPVVKKTQSEGAAYVLPPLSVLFADFWREQTGQAPTKALTDMFLSACEEAEK